MKFIKNTIFTILVIFYPFVSFSADTNSKEENSAKEWVYNHRQPELTRPANFYRIEKSLDDSICNEVLEKLNEEIHDNSQDAGRSILIKNSALLKWTNLNGKYDVSKLEYLEYKINDYNRILYRYNTWFGGRPSIEVSYMQSVLTEEELKGTWLKKIWTFGKQLFFYEPNFNTSFPLYTPPKEQDIDVMLLGKEGLYVLLMSPNVHEYCNKNYDILVRLLTEGQSSPALCHIRSIPKIKCENAKPILK